VILSWNLIININTSRNF